MKREEHLERNEDEARRSLNHLSRRWPTSPNVFYVLLIILLIAILFIAL